MSRSGQSFALGTLRYPFVWMEWGTQRVLEYARLAMGFANIRAGTRVLTLVLVQAQPASAACPLGYFDAYYPVPSTGAGCLQTKPGLAGGAMGTVLGC